jgi:hypothetical protein
MENMERAFRKYGGEHLKYSIEKTPASKKKQVGRWWSHKRSA